MLLVPNKPPEPIEEIPPSVRPDDPSAIWIGGYWGWADDRKDFIWVSGVWRVPPPNMQWVPGYWAQVPGGYQWTAGFWSPVGRPQTTYYPAPPATQEKGPKGDPPSAHCCWVSGCWRWHKGRFAWQAGYWAPAQEGLIWVPASYYWCPRGWAFSGGYWDYPLAARATVRPLPVPSRPLPASWFRLLPERVHRLRDVDVQPVRAARLLPLLFWRLLRGGVRLAGDLPVVRRGTVSRFRVRSALHLLSLVSSQSRSRVAGESQGLACVLSVASRGAAPAQYGGPSKARGLEEARGRTEIFFRSACRWTRLAVIRRAGSKWLAFRRPSRRDSRPRPFRPAGSKQSGLAWRARVRAGTARVPTTLPCPVCRKACWLDMRALAAAQGRGAGRRPCGCHAAPEA